MPLCIQWREKRFPERDCLGALVLVMREDEVLPAPVKVEAFAKKGERHDHALGMPTGTPWAEGRRPERLSRLRLFPEGEVERRALLLVDLHAGSRAHRLEALVGEQPVVGDRRDTEVDAVAGLIGRAESDQLGDQLDHLVDEGCGVRDLGRKQAAQLGHRLPPLLLVLGGHLLRAALLLVCPVDDLVVDVGDVRNVVDDSAGVLEETPQDVVDEGETSVANMGRPVHRRAAYVDARSAWLTGFKLFAVARGSVM